MPTLDISDEQIVTLLEQLPEPRRVRVLNRFATAPNVPPMPRGLTPPKTIDPARVAQMREQAKHDAKADALLRAEWQAEADAMTPHERATESLRFANHMVNMNANRSVGERILYLDADIAEAFADAAELQRIADEGTQA